MRGRVHTPSHSRSSGDKADARLRCPRSLTSPGGSAGHTTRRERCKPRAEWAPPRWSMDLAGGAGGHRDPLALLARPPVDLPFGGHEIVHPRLPRNVLLTHSIARQAYLLGIPAHHRRPRARPAGVSQGRAHRTLGPTARPGSAERRRPSSPLAASMTRQTSGLRIRCTRRRTLGSSSMTRAVARLRRVSNSRSTRGLLA
jgi:hypothetical protein